jgi:hypothetical protein
VGVGCGVGDSRRTGVVAGIRVACSTVNDDPGVAPYAAMAGLFWLVNSKNTNNIAVVKMALLISAPLSAFGEVQRQTTCGGPQRRHKQYRAIVCQSFIYSNSFTKEKPNCCSSFAHIAHRCVNYT